MAHENSATAASAPFAGDLGGMGIVVSNVRTTLTLDSVSQLIGLGGMSHREYAA